MHLAPACTYRTYRTHHRHHANDLLPAVGGAYDDEEDSDGAATDAESGDLIVRRDPCARVCLCVAPLTWPLATVVLAAVMLFVFYVFDDGGAQLLLTSPLPWSRAWTLLTFCFVHADAEHLWGNLLPLVLFGALLEMVDGATTVVAAFFLSSAVGVAAELLYHVALVHADQPSSLASLHPSGCMLFAGSSAGVAGLGGALAGFMLINWEEAFAAFRFAYGPSVPCGLRTLLLLLAALYAALEIATIVRDPDNGVANVAHLGGLAFGALYAFGGGRNVVSRWWETTARALAGLVAFAALAALLVLLGVRMGEWTAEGVSERCFEAR